MLAYSSIAHAGFLLTGFVGLHSVASFAGDEISSLQAVLFYLVDLRLHDRSARSRS